MEKKLSELISELARMKDKYGDIPVTCYCETMDAGAEVTYSEDQFEHIPGPVVLIGEKP